MPQVGFNVDFKDFVSASAAHQHVQQQREQQNQNLFGVPVLNVAPDAIKKASVVNNNPLNLRNSSGVTPSASGGGVSSTFSHVSLHSQSGGASSNTSTPSTFASRPTSMGGTNATFAPAATDPSLAQQLMMQPMAENGSVFQHNVQGLISDCGGGVHHTAPGGLQSHEDPNTMLGGHYNMVNSNDALQYQQQKSSGNNMTPIDIPGEGGKEDDSYGETGQEEYTCDDPELLLGAQNRLNTPAGAKENIL